MSFVIFTDTSANLPIESVRQNDIKVVPLTYIVDGAAMQCTDSSTFDAKAFYGSLKEKNVTTSMVNMSSFMDAWTPYLNEGRDILYLAMASGISGSYAASCAARDALAPEYPDRRIVTFDTIAASLGEGFYALYAARLQKEGKDLDAVLEALRLYRTKQHQIFTVDDLMFLYRGGRVSRMTALAGTVLSIKPILIGSSDARLVVIGKTRGRKNAIRRLAQEYIEHKDRSKPWVVGIAHAACEEDVKLLISYIKADTPDAQIMTVDYEPVTGSHVGPGALALFFVGTPHAVDVE